MKLAVMSCAALGGFLFGYDTTVINAALFQMKDHFGFSEHSWLYALIVAIALVGAFIGAFAAGFISARFGRRPCIGIADILFIVGSVLMAAAPNPAVVLVSRVIVGLAIGISSATIPVYLAEVTSPKHRGAAIVTNTLFLTFAQFIAAGFACIMVIFTDKNVGWRVAIGVGAVPAIVQLIGIIIWLPESPRWLHCKGDEEKAKLVAERYDVDLADLENAEVRSVNMNYLALISRDMLFRVVLGCALQAIQQFSGINTIMYYSSVILQDAGFDDPKMPVILSVPLALMNAIFTIVAIFTVDRFGRRTLMIASCLGCLITTIVVTVVGFLLDKQIPYSIGGWVFLALLAVFLACYAPGIGCIPWVVMGEIFPTHLRTTAASVATMTNWAANALVSQVFPLLLGAIGVGGTFAIICGLLALSLVYLWFFMVETKGLTLEQLDNMFRKRAGLEPIYDNLDDPAAVDHVESADVDNRISRLMDYHEDGKGAKTLDVVGAEDEFKDGFTAAVEERELDQSPKTEKGKGKKDDTFSNKSGASAKSKTHLKKRIRHNWKIKKKK
ncbi:MFS transporter, SP family, solute carrier family 2 (myo-inositol transporter), member 13 [Angomonas deanei]|nr:MFS transporter, SP family, solute carrier family 2 (myo-inositol transporter), member 13 [Angomonas deanei]|eukprot:EPY35151.1 MFS transporter, SP family, solute carrier family 2 (myo-inositol transporter), member 13 [Angomonas deanei]